MCGIAGIWDPSASPEALARRVTRMTDAIRHRGPDDSGAVVLEPGVALGHRRLSILDLSAHGHQPMASRSGRYHVTYNGEIYNFRRLRAELEPQGHRFTGHSDTEVLLAAVEAWGLEDAVTRFVGMFAFALFDEEDLTLSLVRDRLGIKPLAYGAVGPSFCFASELHALRADPDLDLELDRAALGMVARYACVPEPFTAYRGIRKLAPGSIATVRADHSVRERRYWCVEDVVRAGRRDVRPLAEKLAALETTLDDAVALRMISDVPLGAFLSGGIDSSLVVARMQRQSSSPVETFTIGYEDALYDETEDAAKVAEHLGTKHHALRFSAREVLDVVERLGAIYDEPFADSSQLPTTLVSELARRHVTVVLTGDGGDEIFFGYNRHVWGERAWRLRQRVPGTAARALGGLLARMPAAALDALSSRADTILPERYRVRGAGDKVHKLGALARARSMEDVYRGLATTQWRGLEPRRAELVRADPLEAALSRFRDLELSFPELAAAVDTAMFLPGDILTKVDRASMSVALEARVPILDHRVVELAWSLPPEAKIRGGVGKHPLRALLARDVPRALFERPKMGFGVPIHAWLRAELRGFAEELLSERALADTGVFEPRVVRDAWATHLAGTRNLHPELWGVLMVQAWLRDRARS